MTSSWSFILQLDTALLNVTSRLYVQFMALVSNSLIILSTAKCKQHFKLKNFVLKATVVLFRWQLLVIVTNGMPAAHEKLCFVCIRSSVQNVFFFPLLAIEANQAPATVMRRLTTGTPTENCVVVRTS